ncbi:rhodanese-like domain-containing protein [Paenibacillus sp. FJAT-26967]|uniref:rhodanese-like domain-containing protein n=1 Tax=Paenibacillus sp. FJAT-26967 TaxID=1729690 RepID=UPI000837C089|nr:rhodanese-like domain-containing protein [Paenibacillus sp. FJAT-26967]
MINEILPDDVKRKLENGEILHIVDVREDEEWESGHIRGAKHLPLGSLEQRHGELGKGQEIIVVCRSGNRSGMACGLLDSLGYHVTNMPGGMMEWNGEIVTGR